MRFSLVWTCLLAPLPAVDLLHGEDSFDGKIVFERSGLPAEALKTQGPAIFYDTKADASQWADLKLRFVYDGLPPKPKRFALDGGGTIKSEQLVVNARTWASPTSAYGFTGLQARPHSVCIRVMPKRKRMKLR